MISVIIPTRNRAALLEQAIESLWKQTLPAARFEILVMDNLSTDDTAERVRSMQERSPCALFFHVMPTNGGPAPSRNEAARRARGSLLAFIDSDCRACPEWLAEVAAPFEDEGVALVTGPVLDKPDQERGPFSRVTGGVDYEHPSYPAANAVFRRSVFQQLGGFDEALCFRDPLDRSVECADTDLAWRIKESGHRNVFVKDAVVYHEVENQTRLQWLLEPTRLWVLPALVQRHPQLRPRLLRGGLFFCKEDLLIVLAGLGVLLALLVHPSFLLLAVPYALALPYLWWAILIRGRPAPPGRILGLVPYTLLLAVRQTLMVASLACGSVRFRTLVL
jgi:glycosyltransferase involved in cell wall biosynthesis